MSTPSICTYYCQLIIGQHLCTKLPNPSAASVANVYNTTPHSLIFHVFLKIPAGHVYSHYVLALIRLINYRLATIAGRYQNRRLVMVIGLYCKYIIVTLTGIIRIQLWYIEWSLILPEAIWCNVNVNVNVNGDAGLVIVHGFIWCNVNVNGEAGLVIVHGFIWCNVNVNGDAGLVIVHGFIWCNVNVNGEAGWVGYCSWVYMV